MPKLFTRRRALLAALIGLLSAASGMSATPVAPKPTPWSFAALKPVALPVVKGTPIGNEVDLFTAAKLQEKGLGFSPEADRVTLIRRLLLDVWGLPPTPEEVRAFVSNKDPMAWEKLVDHVLASPHYGERWARHWLDVVRFSETNGFEMNQPRPNAWPYRDWVIAALNSDMPYDQFVFNQIAGDSAGQDAATGYLVAGAFDQVKGDPVLNANQRQDEFHDMVSTTGTAFLGLTMGCARCHDHKFDPILQKDYYSFQAVFQGVSHSDRRVRIAPREEKKRELAEVKAALGSLQAQLTTFEPLAARVVKPGAKPTREAVNALGNVDHFTPIAAKFVRFTVLASSTVEPCIDELEIFTAPTAGHEPRNVALASAGSKAIASGCYANNPSHKIEHINDGLYGNEYSWISDANGAGWIEIQFPEAQMIDTIRWARDRNGRYTDRVPTRYRIDVATEPGRWTTVATSEDRIEPGDKISSAALADSLDPAQREKFKNLTAEIAKLQTRRDELASAVEGRSLYAGGFTQPGPTFILTRGDPMTPSKIAVGPDGIVALNGSLGLPANAPEQQRRVALAKWITSPENPLTPRVIVNRIWQHHFGVGLVETPSDFGNNGFKPTHPELLDYLASRLIAEGWSMKSIHRLILLSSTYRQSSAPRAEGLAADAGSRLLWRYPPHRMEAEPIRDCVLATSGVLDLTMGGPGWSAFKPNTNYVRFYDPRDDWGPTEWRRTVYMTNVRMRVDGVFGNIDVPDGGQVAPKRPCSTTALQALNLFNSSFMIQQADLLAKRLEREAGGDPADQVRRAYALAYSRTANDAEVRTSVAFIAQQGLREFCRAILNSNEFVFIP